MKLLCIGDVGIDYYKNLGKKFVGGIAFNFAINACECGAKVSVLSVIGKDDELIILNTLKQKHVDFNLVQVINGKSALQNIILHEDGKREFIGYYPGVLYQLDKNLVNENDLNHFDVVTCPLSDGIEWIAEKLELMKLKGLKVIDISVDHDKFNYKLIDKYIKSFDIIFIGGNKEAQIYIETLKFPKEKVVVITLGKAGSIAYHNGIKYTQGIIPSVVVDSTGCGDAFQAGFTVEYVKTRDIKKSLLKGSIQASKVISHIGGIKQ